MNSRRVLSNLSKHFCSHKQISNSDLEIESTKTINWLRVSIGNRHISLRIAHETNSLKMIYISKISIIILICVISIACSVHSEGAPSARLVGQQMRGMSGVALENNSNENPIKRPRRHVVVVTLESAPFMMKRMTGEHNSTVEWYGYCMDFFNKLIDHLPYEVTYEIYQVADNKFGVKTKQFVSGSANDTGQSNQVKLERWNGLIGDLVQGKADLALAPMSVMAERELAIDFTVPFYDLIGIQILLKKPEVPQDWFKFLTVLDREVWFSITIAYFVSSFVIFLFDRLSPYSHKNLARIQKMKKKHKMVNSNQDKNLINRHGKNNMINSISGNLRLPAQGKFVHGDHLAKSHQLFVGSLVDPRRNERNGGLATGSSLFSSGFDAIFGKRQDSVSPSDANATSVSRWQQNGGIGRKLSDIFKTIDFRKREFSWEFDADSSDNDDGKPDFGLRDSLWFCITSLTPQGGGEAPQNLSGRLVAGAWWLFCFIIIASYTANLAAFLTVSRLDIPIESLDDLSKQYRIKYAPIAGTSEQTYFERMAYIEEIFYNIWKDMSLNDSLSDEERSKFAIWDYPISDKYTRIWTQIQQVGMPESPELGVKRVKNSNLDDGFALLADANTVKHAVMTDCSLKAVGDEFSRKPIALGMRKGDEQFKHHLSYAILKLINQRFMEILREKWWTNNPHRVVCDNNDESEGISIDNIGGVFIIIFAGVALSFIVWAIERFVYKTKIRVSQELIQRL